MSSSEGRLVLVHRGFAALGEIIFQRSENGDVPVALIPLGGRPAAVPVRALQRELGIPDDSEDGCMLALVAESLDYVEGLRQGDLLPAEVLTGEASWEPEAKHLAAAQAWLRSSLMLWATAANPAADLASALQSLAVELGEPDAAAAAARMEELAVELSYIEASRDRLLNPVKKLAKRLDVIRSDHAPHGSRLDEVTQSQRLIAVAFAKISARFLDVATRTAEVAPALRGLAGLRTYIRSNRDWLHRSRLAWEPLLQGWEKESNSESRWALVSQTYRFLAQRFMTTQEWKSIEQRRLSQPPPEKVLQW